MKIFALDSDTDEFQELINSLAEKISIDLFDDFDGMMEVVDEECQAVLMDFDIDQRKKNKMIGKIKKMFPDMNIFLLANDLDAKKLTKHQKSKEGANVYFQTPIDPDILDSILEPFLGDDAPLDESEVIKEHVQEKKLSATASDISQSIDGAFSSTFFDEYNGVDEEGEEESADLSEIKLDQAGEEVSMDEVSMDEVSMDEMEIGDEELDSISLSDDNVADDGFSLDSSDSDNQWEQEDELSLSPEDDGQAPVSNIAFPDEDDLSFPDDAPVKTTDSGLTEMELKDEGSLVEMDLSEDEMVVTNTEDSGLEMDLSAAEELDFGSGDEVASSDPEDLNEFSLGDIEALEEDENVVTVEDVDTGDEISLGDDNTSPSQVFNLGADDHADVQGLDDGLEELNFGSDAQEEGASEMNTSASIISGMDDDLRADDDEVQEITKTQVTNPLKALSEESSDDDLDLDLTVDEDVDELSLSVDDDSEVMNLEDDSQKFSLKVPGHLSEEIEGEDSIGDLLDKAAKSNAPSRIKEFEMPLSEESQIIQNVKDMTETGLTIQGVMIPKDLKQQEDISSSGITFANQPEMARGKEAGRAETKTSIQLTDESLSSIDLPDTPDFAHENNDESESLYANEMDEDNIEDQLAQTYEEEEDFSTTVNQKLQEIDNMIGDEAEYEEDKTMVVSASDIQTNIYATQGISDDTTTIHQVAVDDYDDQTAIIQNMAIPKVPEDLRREHRDYVQSHDEELIRLGETIKSLREDREALLNKVADFESFKDDERRELLNLKAMLDEKNIELVVVKKRMEKQNDDLRFQLDIALDKKELYSKQNEQLKKEVEKLTRQTKLDINKIRSRERELEEKLEMLRNDAEVQIRNRDQKILELKRKIDTLEFDVENSHLKEKQSVDNQMDLQDKMNKVIKTLRGAIGQLEDDYGADERKNAIKKNLDI